MFLPLLLAASAFQPPSDSPYTTAPVFAEPRRMEMTPTLDGKIDAEEWDELSAGTGFTTYFQYQPGMYHFAASLPAGQDLIVSLDQDSDGWLQGKDNLEFRIHVQDGKAQVTARQLDGTRKEGPVWIDQPGFTLSSMAATGTDANGAVIEATIIDPGVSLLEAKPGLKPSIRIDAVPADAPTAAPYLPRVLTGVQFVLDRATALPETLKFGVEAKNRAVVPGESMRLRYTFNGTNDLGTKRVGFHGEGVVKEMINVVEKPFPGFDDKKRAFVDYDTSVGKGATLGYRLLHTVVSFDKGPESVIESSFRVAPLVDIDLVPVVIRASDAPQDARITFYIRSNSASRVSGNFKVAMPAEFSVKSSGQGDFSIYDYRGNLRRVLNLIIPRISAGTYPVQFTGSADGQPFERTIYITVSAGK